MCVVNMAYYISLYLFFIMSLGIRFITLFQFRIKLLVIYNGHGAFNQHLCDHVLGLLIGD